MPASERIRGFTLIELAIVLAISGMVLAAGVGLYRLYLHQQDMSDTYDNIQTIDNSLLKYLDAVKHYPCPADRGLPSTDPNYGVANCAAAIAMGTCNPSGGLCVAGGRDTGRDGIPGPDAVLIGAVPFKTIVQDINAANGSATLDDVNMERSLDSWGHQFTYAVPLALTDATKFNAALGAISVVMEDHITSLVTPADSAQFVIVSHGADGIGGFTPNGILSAPCASAPPYEQENCNNDAKFMGALLSLGQGPAYNDDIVFFQSWALSSLWDITPTDPLSIYNKNPGNVGIGTGTPAQKLDVNGSVTGANLKSAMICDSTGANCFAPADLGGPVGIDCTNTPAAPGNFKALQGIANRQPKCSPDLPLPTALPAQTCAVPGQFVSGIDATGHIQCSAL